eukprot:1982035-Rhodomonas_salina.1
MPVTTLSYRIRQPVTVLSCRYCGNFPVVDPSELGLPDNLYYDKLFHDRQVQPVTTLSTLSCARDHRIHPILRP